MTKLHFEKLTDLDLISQFQSLDKEQHSAHSNGVQVPLRTTRLREQTLSVLYERYNRVTNSYLRKNEKFINASGTFDKWDIVNEIHVALMLAAREFDVSSGNAFMTYARFKITERVNAFIRQNSSQVKVLTSAKSKKAKSVVLAMKKEDASEQEMVNALMADLRFKEYEARSFINSIMNAGRVEISLQAGNYGTEDGPLKSIEDEIHDRGITSGSHFSTGEEVLVGSQRAGVLRAALNKTFQGTHPALKAAFLKRFGIADDFANVCSNTPLSELDSFGTYAAIAQDLAQEGFKGNGDCMTDENVRIIVQKVLDNVRSEIEGQGLQLEDLMA